LACSKGIVGVVAQASFEELVLLSHSANDVSIGLARINGPHNLAQFQAARRSTNGPRAASIRRRRPKSTDIAHHSNANQK
jgi:hypothetical protein